MIHALCTTLYDAIRGGDDDFTLELKECVQLSLDDLEDRIFDLDWANIQILAA